MHKESFRKQTCPPPPCHGLPAFLGCEDTFDTKRMKHLWQDLRLYLFSIAAYRCTKHYQFWHAKKKLCWCWPCFFFQKTKRSFAFFFLQKETIRFPPGQFQETLQNHQISKGNFCKNHIPRDARAKSQASNPCHQIRRQLCDRHPWRWRKTVRANLWSLGISGCSKRGEAGTRKVKLNQMVWGGFTYCWWFRNPASPVDIWWISPIIYQVSCMLQLVQDFGTINSTTPLKFHRVSPDNQFEILEILKGSVFLASTSEKKHSEGCISIGTTKHETVHTFTSPKFNIAPENRESQKETHLPTIRFQGLC